MKKVKYLILVALMAIFVSVPASAEFRFGVKAGLNINKLHLSNFGDNVSSDNRCGFTAGVMTEFTVPIIGIGADLSLMYTHMNERINDAGDKGSINKNFLEIPLNLKYKFNIPVVASIIKPMVYTGPTLALKLDKSAIDDLKTKTAQWGWNLGIGVELIKHLQISGGYTFGINNIVKKTGLVDEVIKDVKLKNNYWTVTAAWLF